MELIRTVQESIAVVHYGGPILALLSVLVFELPRYLMSTLAIGLFGFGRRDTLDRASRISVIIPVFNGVGGLASTVHSLRSQSANVIEVVVVDDGSRDGTLAIARALKSAGLVTRVIHHEQRTGKSAAINHAARFAKGDLLVGRLSGLSRQEIEGILEQMGRLIGYTRQLDARLDSDEIVTFLARRFLDGNYHLDP